MKIEPFKIKVTPEQSKIVQEVLFKNGYAWKDRTIYMHDTKVPYLYLDNNGMITYGYNTTVFYRHQESELTFEQFKQKYMQPENELVISIPTGMQIDIENSDLSKNKIALKPIEKKPLTFKEIAKEEDGSRGFYLGAEGINPCILYLDSELMSTDCRTEQDAKKASAFIKYLRVASYYNEKYAGGYKVDWGNGKSKYHITYDYKLKRYIICYSQSYTHGGIYFATKELAQMMIDNNKDILDAYYLD